jgi:5,10-methylenetetrahydromethanopterin reductase
VHNRQVSIAFQTNKPLSAYGPLAKRAEDYGFDGISVYNDMLYQPAWLPLLEIARATRRAQIGPIAVNPFTCHPINIAGHIALLDEASHGRAYLGMARGSWLDFVGLHPQRPISALREAFSCVHHLLRQSEEPLPGAHFPLAGGASLRWKIARPDIPFLLGAWGPKTIRACIAFVRAVKIGGTANPDVVPYFRKIIDQAIEQTDRQTGDVGIVVGAVTVVDRDSAAAKARARREVALYLPVVAALDPTLALEPELMNRLKMAADRYDFDAAGALISDELLEKFAFAGTPDEIAAQADALFRAGVNRVEFGTPHGLNEETGLRLLGEAVLPALRR